jgi:uncharacterized protein YndB with AHSA1/START domain
MSSQTTLDVLHSILESKPVGRPIRWKLHLGSPPDIVFAYLSTDEGRRKFWVEDSQSSGNDLEFTFSNGLRCHCRIVVNEPPNAISFFYFGSVVEFRLASDGAGGTDLTVTNAGVGESEWLEVYAGWLNVLFPLKAAVDFGIDLRSHDKSRTWEQGFVDG